MSGIVLSASVRQNLLSLQSTAALLATTQNDLATGNKVNSALDNPTSFFTAHPSTTAPATSTTCWTHRQRRAGAAGRQHRHHLAAEPGRQRPVDRQPGASGPHRLLDEVHVTSAAITGATANNLLGTGTNATRTPARPSRMTTQARRSTITAATQLVGTAGATSDDLATAITNGSVLTVDGKNITFSTGADDDDVRRQRQRHDRHRYGQHGDRADRP